MSGERKCEKCGEGKSRRFVYVSVHTGGEEGDWTQNLCALCVCKFRFLLERWRVTDRWPLTDWSDEYGDNLF